MRALLLLLALCTNLAFAQGFHVSGPKLLGPDGKEFRIRGVNHNHLDNGSPGLPLSSANTVRLVLNYTPLAMNLDVVKNQTLAKGMVPMPGDWRGTCNSDPAVLTAIVDTWVAQASTWAPMSDRMLFNIANEWGPPNSAVWRDSYATALKRMRAAGYTSTLVVDSGGCGQDPLDVVKYGADVLAADPLHNVLFDVHVYGGFVLNPDASWKTDYAKSMAALKATGLPIIIGEFGPGRSVGPSPTTITPERIIADAEANGWGWMAWAWDDNNLTACGADDNWFSMTTSCGKYTGKDTELTTFGRIVLPLFSKYGATRVTVAAPSVAPVLTSALPLHCKPSYSCSMQLSATSAAGSKVSYSAAVLPAGVYLTTAGVLSWYEKPVAGDYPITIVLKDAAGNVSTVPVTLNVSW